MAREDGSTRRSGRTLRARARLDGAFYAESAECADGKPGDIVRVEPMVAHVVPGVRMRANAWRILYRTTSATGVPTIASGTVLVPKSSSSGPRPLIGYAIGSQGMAVRCAPSHQLAIGTEYEALLIAAVLRKGWAVALTDYPGLGTGGGHPYVVGRALGPAVLDSMRAARNLTAAGLGSDGPAALFGYSEGGTAAGWAAQLQPSYAPDVPLVGASIGGACADLEFASDFLTGGRFAWLQGYGAIGLDAAYPELQLDRYLNERGRRMAAALADSNLIPQIVRRLPRKYVRDNYVVRNPLDEPDWSARILENKLGGIAPAAPILLTHGRWDQAVGYAQAPRLHEDWRSLGVDVEFRGFRGLEHLGGGLAHMFTALPWLARHIAAGVGSRRAAA